MGVAAPVPTTLFGRLGEPAADAARAFLQCNGVPTRWVDVKREPMFLETSHPGVFVAGDARHGSIKRVASAVGDGAMATSLVHRFLAIAQAPPG